MCRWGGSRSSYIWSTVSVHSFWKCDQAPSPHLAFLSDVMYAASVATWVVPLPGKPSADSEGWALFQEITLVKGSDFPCWNELCAGIIVLMDINGFIFEVCNKGICWKGFSWCTDNYLFYLYSVFLCGDFLSSFSHFFTLCYVAKPGNSQSQML